MRFKKLKILLCFVILCFIWVKVYFNLNVSHHLLNENLPSVPTMPIQQHKIVLSELVTIILREFDVFENDVTLTAQSYINMFPNIMLWIIYNEVPYPPLDLAITNNSLSNVKLYNLSPNLKQRENLLTQMKTDYILFVPDSSRITAQQPLQIMVEELQKNPDSIVAVPIFAQTNSLKCLRLIISQQEWTIKYSLTKTHECDEVSGKHLIMIRKDILNRVFDPFLLPFPHSLYIQTSVQNIQVKIMKINSLHQGKAIFKSHQSQMKKKQQLQGILNNFYHLFRIKQVIRENGVSEWYGCSKDTPRCFGAVLDSMPSYLYEKRWTPPCCMANLRKTARHVFSILDEAGMRYWLEAGSLLGAMRSGDILPWDYNVDIGFVREDINRCKWLKKARNKQVVDKKGFLWEKGTEGNSFKVSYSKVNNIHVNIFPFYSKNGTMVRDSWITSHKNMEFSESFLHPMSSLDFIGRSVPSPNNIRDFLEFKYGKGCIENPEYPDPNKLKFP